MPFRCAPSAALLAMLATAALISGTIGDVASAKSDGVVQHGNRAATDPLPTRALQYAGTGTGAIPDAGGAPGDCGSDATWNYRDVTFTVAGLSGPVQVDALIVDITHARAGDVVLQLIGPDNTSQTPALSQPGATTSTSCGDDTDLAGVYYLTEGAWPTDSIWNALAALGPSDVLPTGTSYYPAGNAYNGNQTSLTAPFLNIDANGTWRLRIYDTGVGETGTINAAALYVRGTEVACVQAVAKTEAAHVAEVKAKHRKDAAKKRVKKAKAHLDAAKRTRDAAKVAQATKKLAKVRKAFGKARQALFRAEQATNDLYAAQMRIC